eukprot:3422261-Rhodomonas_salina.1
MWIFSRERDALLPENDLLFDTSELQPRSLGSKVASFESCDSSLRGSVEHAKQVTVLQESVEQQHSPRHARTERRSRDLEAGHERHHLSEPAIHGFSATAMQSATGSWTFDKPCTIERVFRKAFASKASGQMATGLPMQVPDAVVIQRSEERVDVFSAHRRLRERQERVGHDRFIVA